MNEWLAVKFKDNYADEFDIVNLFVVRKTLYEDFVRSVQEYDDYPIEISFGTNEWMDYSDPDDVLGCFKTVPVSTAFVEEFRSAFGDRWSAMDRIGQTEFFDNIMDDVMQ